MVIGKTKAKRNALKITKIISIKKIKIKVISSRILKLKTEKRIVKVNIKAKRFGWFK